MADRRRSLVPLADRADDESGAVLVLFAGALVVLLGMAAFAIDLGWLYFNGVQAQKAAEAGALAGVVHLPLPIGDPLAGSEAESVAFDLAERNGFTNGGVETVDVKSGGTPHRLTVETSRDVNTFFMRVFGWDTVEVGRRATAEQLPAIKMGGRGSELGNQTTQGFWLAINGEHSSIAQGDQFATRCKNERDITISQTLCDYRNDPGTPVAGIGQFFRDPAYYYAIEVTSGGDLDLDIWDAPNWRTGRDPSNLDNIIANDGGIGATTRFRLFPPDDTPLDPRDNSVLGALCDYSFRAEDHAELIDPETNGIVTVAEYRAKFRNQWALVPGCFVGGAELGVYVLEVTVDGGTSANTFGLREVGTSDAQVFGIEWMSIMGSDAGAAVFDLAQIGGGYAGRKIEVNLFDPGETAGDSWLQIDQAGNPHDCRYRVRDHNGAYVDSNGIPISNPGPEDGWRDDEPGPTCRIQTSDLSNRGCRPPSVFNCSSFDADILEIEFALPFDYSCSGDECWWTVTYDYPAPPVTDRTTWGVTVKGQPIHLLNEFVPPPAP